MKLVIDIPEEEYERMREQSVFGIMLGVWKQAIKNGTPLPKGHGRLIDEDELLRKLKSWDANTNGIPNYAWKSIRDTKTVISNDSTIVKLNDQ